MRSRTRFLSFETDLPNLLRRAVKVHLSEAIKNDYDTADGAAGLCEEASNEFLETLKNLKASSKGILHKFVLYPETKEQKQRARADLKQFPFDPDGCIYHCVVKVGDIFIDWTARQFGEDNPFPAIWKDNMYGS